VKEGGDDVPFFLVRVYISLRSLGRAASVCKDWLALTRGPEAWEAQLTFDAAAGERLRERHAHPPLSPVRLVQHAQHARCPSQPGVPGPLLSHRAAAGASHRAPAASLDIGTALS
jgi:hypothetical protein